MKVSLEIMASKKGSIMLANKDVVVEDSVERSSGARGLVGIIGDKIRFIGAYRPHHLPASTSQLMLTLARPSHQGKQFLQHLFASTSCSA